MKAFFKYLLITVCCCLYASKCYGQEFKGLYKDYETDKVCSSVFVIGWTDFGDDEEHEYVGIIGFEFEDTDEVEHYFFGENARLVHINKAIPTEKGDGQCTDYYMLIPAGKDPDYYFNIYTVVKDNGRPININIERRSTKDSSNLDTFFILCESDTSTQTDFYEALLGMLTNVVNIKIEEPY